MRRYVLGIVVVLFIFTFGVTLGQSFDSEPNIEITASPTDPEPGESVVLNLTSYEADLNLAYIVWTYGSQTKSGYGETQFTINTDKKNTGGIGVSAAITLTDGTKITKDISLAVSSYDITWEALNSKYPPFYMGKRIPIKENDLRVAVINPGNIPKQTSFTWERNGSSLKSKGSSINPYVDFKNSELEKKENISVTITGLDNKAERSIDIPFTKNRIIFYGFDVLSGLKTEKAVINDLPGYEGTSSLLAIPLGLNLDSKPLITWNLSGEEVNNQSNPYLLSFGTPDKSGIVKLSAQIENLKSLYQEFLGSLSLNF